MAQRKKQKIAQAEVVRLFAERLREVRLSRGLTQAELAHHAHVSEAYLGRLERAETSPGIELVDRLAKALGATSADLLPASPTPDAQAVLKDQARSLFDGLVQKADRHTLEMLCELLRMLKNRAK